MYKWDIPVILSCFPNISHIFFIFNEKYSTDKKETEKFLLSLYGYIFNLTEHFNLSTHNHVQVEDLIAVA